MGAGGAWYRGRSLGASPGPAPTRQLRPGGWAALGRPLPLDKVVPEQVCHGLCLCVSPFRSCFVQVFMFQNDLSWHVFEILQKKKLDYVFNVFLTPHERQLKNVFDIFICQSFFNS